MILINSKILNVTNAITFIFTIDITSVNIKEKYLTITKLYI